MQIPLPIHYIDECTFDNFYAENSLALLDSLRQNFEEVKQPFFYIWGSKSSGKSHLLRAICNHYLEHQRVASYVPLEKSRYFTPEFLEDIDQLDLLCLDDIQEVLGKPEWELALYSLFNTIRAQYDDLFNQTTRKTLLLISGDRPLNLLQPQLPDLHSRLSWGEMHQLGDLNDDQKRVILQRSAHDKGLDLSDDVANFLLKRLDRDLQSLLHQLDILDRASLQAQRRLTLPFVKEILGL